MFRKPWQIWLSFAAIVALVTPGLAWLSWHVLALDYQERLTRVQAEQEERISLALWRMETVAMPIIAAEAARPHFVYEPFNSAVSAEGTVSVFPSPLLQQPSDYVLLNFQLNPGNVLFSPQCPSDTQVDLALQNGLTTAAISANCSLAEELQNELSLERLLACLPQETVNSSTIDPSGETSGPGAGAVQQDEQSQLPQVGAYVTNSGEPQVAQQLVPQVQSRSQGDYASRASKLNIFAEQSAVSQRANWDLPAADLTEQVLEGVSRPLWVNGKLLVARRVERSGESVIQGCWLNWPRLEADLRAELSDLPSETVLKPIADGEPAAPGRSLASLPVELVVPDAVIGQASGTPTQIALALAWGGFIVSFGALAFLLRGVAVLSERRAAFVSAVTHELRTPLTTFQLYTEMLSGRMVQDEAQQREYIDTLHREAGRLGHLIENVLAYSRLERCKSNGRAERATVGDLLERVTTHLQARCEQSQRPLVIEIANGAAAAEVQIDPTVLEQALLNLVDNACKYSPTAEDRRILLTATAGERTIDIGVRDFGPGLSTEARGKLFRPFSKSDVEAARSAPGLGLGLSISRELVRAQGGDLVYEPKLSPGACFTIQLPLAG
jgi:signal transduction histidine kinase